MTRFITVALLVALALAAAGCGSSNETASKPSTTYYTPPPAWPTPKGYTVWSDGVAYRWAQGKCYRATACWLLDVKTENGCPRALYAEVSISRPDGVVIGYANDLLGSLPARTTGRLRLKTYEGRGNRLGARLTKLSCY